MSCRTGITKDVTNPDDPYHMLGRGNLAPHTIGLPILALEAKDRFPENPKEGMKTILREVLKDAEETLILRYEIMAEQPPTVAPFMYENGSMLDGEKCKDTVRECLKHGTLAIGYIGIAEMCKVLFDKYHCEDNEARKYALEIVQIMYDYAKELTEKYTLNFSIYATPKFVGA